MANLQTASYMLRPDQVAMIKALAKDQGDSTASAAMRKLLDQWSVWAQAESVVMPGRVRTAEEAALADGAVLDAR